jgi:HNH endonuclease
LISNESTHFANKLSTPIFIDRDTIVDKLKSLVSDERKITAEILKYLSQVERLKIYLELGYPSLFEFCVKELKYSESAAQRRISTMRLTTDLPEIKEKILSGTISLSVATQAHSFFRLKNRLNKPLNKNEKLNLLTQLENTTTRECEKTLLALEPGLITNDRDRYIDPETLEIKITVNSEFIKRLETLKNRLSHKMPNATTKDIITHALYELVKNTDRQFGASLPAPAVESKNGLSHDRAKNSVSKITPSHEKFARHNSNSRYISAEVRRSVWQKYKGQCCYIHPGTKARCSAKQFIEIDHIIPISKGGKSEYSNLQLLCDAHNRYKAAKIINPGSDSS